MPKELIDLKGQRFGKLTVNKLAKHVGYKYYWDCSCDCGCKSKIIRGDRLRSGECTDCGCVYKRPRDLREDYVGKRFGNLTVIKEEVKTYKSNSKRYFYDCICDCGEKRIHVSRQNLQSGKTTSCKKCELMNKYDLDSKDYGIGYCKNYGEFYFDKEDYEKIRPYSWTTTKYGYIRASVGDGTHIFMHTLIFGDNKQKKDIDHRNRKKNDNRKSNLREATRGENVINRDPISTNTSGVTGVFYHSVCEKWAARICKDGTEYHLGTFENFDKAVEARKEAEVNLFGEYAYDVSISQNGDVVS